MARKNLLKGLMDTPPAPSDAAEQSASAPASTPVAARVDVAKPRYSSGAIGAVSQSILDLKSRAVQEIETAQIDMAGLRDRLDEDGGIADLQASIAEYGQQVPVLLRPHPETEGRFQIVYGRRRVAALKALGKPVKALIRDLDDQSLILAQGQENSARRDLSFIERVNFARQMREMGYDRKIICDALHVDKTVISRMMSIADRIPVEVIELVGAAPSIGRDRWMKVADIIEEYGITYAPSLAHGQTSDERFEALLKAVTPGKTPPPKKTTLKGHDGRHFTKISRARGSLTLTFNSKRAEGFDEWLVENFEDLHAQFCREQSDADTKG
ncbi:MAG: plasmid partitioning protein RepB [Epibacterium sp.]|nr:plasmid partitioning protein RepB [Epibacterium sp.]NQX72453.1 plasmid partitioning protein RepB [Epibacterium sp.]